MKIVCDNCATKYQIADEKVSGKAFKIRCKKCGHVIVVNKGAGEGGSQAPAPEASVNQEAAPAPAAEAAPPSDAVWHLVIDREQVGPMTPDEVRAKVKGGQVDGETYGWREGFDDWLKLSAIEDFKNLFTANDDQATRRTGSADRAGAAASAAAAPGADLFGAMGKDEPIRTASPGAATIVSDGMQAPDLAALGLVAANAPAPAAASAPAPMAAPMVAPMAAPVQMAAPTQAAASNDGGMDAPVKSMTGARSENSVLFSLNNLSALAGASGGGGPGGAAGKAAAAADKGGFPSVQSEASGLIDIRAMAAATLGSQSVGGGGPSRAPDFLAASDAPPVFTPLAPAVLMPTAESSGVPKWVWPLVGVGGLMFIGMIVTLVVVFTREPAPGPVATTGTGKDPATTTGPATTSPTHDSPSTATNNPPSTSSPGNKPSTPDSSPSTAKPSSSSGDRGEHSSKKEPKKESRESKPAKESKPEKSPEVAAPPPPPPPVKKEKPPKAKDDLDSLLDSASSGSGGKPAKAEKKDLPEQLSMGQVQTALKKVDASSCKGEGASGVIKIKLTIKGNGKADASPADGAAGADCVAKAVKKTAFPEFSGDPMTLTYPFIIR